MTPTTQTPDGRRTGQPRQLARYETDTGQRVLIAKRCSGKVALFDLPVKSHQPRFIVEPHLQSMAELDALISDYLSVAERLGYCPMHGAF